MGTEPVPDLAVETLGAPTWPSPLPPAFWVADEDRVAVESSVLALGTAAAKGDVLPSFERAGPRARLFFEPYRVHAGIVTCGGLCPGLNDVIRALTLALQRTYGVRRVLGFRFGYEGLVERLGHAPLELDGEAVDDIHQHGGTILGSSRGPQDPGEMVDRLAAEHVDLLFTVGGDGTQRGAIALVDEIRRRGLPIAVVGIPKTIDNDIAWIERSFGFETAVAMARPVIVSAHTEAKGAPYGVGLVKLMGRESGFIAAYSALANSEVNACLVPEVPVALDGEDGLLAFLERRLTRRRHAVVVVAEGACQDLQEGDLGRDASGNTRLKDVGPLLAARIRDHFQGHDLPVQVRYFDPSYTIRSQPATASDSVFCLQLAHNAVHAAMAGKTGVLIGTWANQFTHVPMSAAVGHRKRIDPRGWLWKSVLQATGFPRPAGANGRGGL